VLGQYEVIGSSVGVVLGAGDQVQSLAVATPMGGALEASDEEALEDAAGGQSYWGECLGMNTQGLMQLALVSMDRSSCVTWKPRRLGPAEIGLRAIYSVLTKTSLGARATASGTTHVGDVHQLVGSPGGGLWLWSVTEAPS
jgi:hypothetical protein